MPNRSGLRLATTAAWIGNQIASTSRIRTSAMPSNWIVTIGRMPKKMSPSVHRVARHVIGGARPVTQAAGHDRPGVHGDMQGYRLTEPCLPPIVQCRGAVQHVERRLECPRGIVLGSDRGAEQG